MRKIKDRLSRKIRLYRTKLEFKNGWWIYKYKSLNRTACKTPPGKLKLLIIGGTSDIACSFRKRLDQLHIEYSFTARDGQLRPDFILNYNNLDSIRKFINETNFNNYQIIIFFTGFLEPKSDDLPGNPVVNIDSSYIKEAKISFENHTQINALYPYLITRLIGQKLLNTEDKAALGFPRKTQITNFIFITSSIGTSRQSIFPGLYYYRAGKAALHAMLSALYLELNTSQATNRGSRKFGILLLGPGSAKSRMNPNGSITTDESARYITSIIMDTATHGLFLFIDHLRNRLHL